MRGEAPSVASDLYAFGRMMAAVAANAGLRVPDERQRLLERLSADDPRERPSSTSEVLDLLAPARVRAAAFAPPMLRFVGRPDVVSAFTGFVGTLRRRRESPRTFHVHGVDGSGRTRLLEELKWAAQAELDVVALELDDRARRSHHAP